MGLFHVWGQDPFYSYQQQFHKARTCGLTKILARAQSLKLSDEQSSRSVEGPVWIYEGKVRKFYLINLLLVLYLDLIKAKYAVGSIFTATIACYTSQKWGCRDQHVSALWVIKLEFQNIGTMTDLVRSLWEATSDTSNPRTCDLLK